MVYALLYRILDTAFQAAYIILFIRILLSWIPHDRYHPVIEFIYKVTEPMLSPFRDIVPTYKIGIDLSPIFAFIAIGIVKNLVYFLLF
ncbi:hypothetical protein DID80_02155 [Candidatus Marinamargulisbacteria bacterium SCGC AAA071-K20]|nr:hypothetical protein DID80_02155 [Candidatus Marinamargulisbacteria bacterium SCGC AAA071-K20]